MPKRTLTQSVVLLRAGVRVELEASKTHELTNEEIADILTVSPGALSTTATVDLSKDESVADNSKELTAAEKLAAEQAAEQAQAAAAGPSTAGADL